MWGLARLQKNRREGNTIGGRSEVQILALWLSLRNSEYVDAKLYQPSQMRQSLKGEKCTRTLPGRASPTPRRQRTQRCFLSFALMTLARTSRGFLSCAFLGDNRQAE